MQEPHVRDWPWLEVHQNPYSQLLRLFWLIFDWFILVPALTTLA